MNSCEVMGTRREFGDYIEFDKSNSYTPPTINGD